MAILSKFAASKRIEPFVYSDDVKVVPKDVVWVIILGSVRNIPARMFAGCEYLERLDIWDGLETIGNNAFYGCTALKLVRLPKTSRVIGKGAFCHCSAMTCVVLNDGLVEIGNFSFSQCESLQLFVLSSTVRLLGESVCEGCKSLEAVGLNEGLDWVQECAFLACDKLTVIGIPNSMERLGTSAIPDAVRQECKKPDELWATIRDKVEKLADSIHNEFITSCRFAPETKTGKQMIEAQTNTPSNKENPSNKTAVGKKSASTDDSRKVVGLGSLRSLLFPQDNKGKAQEPRKTNAKEACGKKMIKLSAKSPLLDGSGDGASLNADQVETKELINALTFLRTEDEEKKMKLPEKFNAERKCKGSLNRKPAFKPPATLDPSSRSKPWEERILQSMEAKIKARDGETKAQLLIFQNLLNDVRKEMKKNNETMASGVAEKLEKVSSGLRDLEKRLKNVQDGNEARDSETRAQFRTIEQQHNHCKDHMSKQSHLISNAASAYQRLTGDMQDLTGRMDSCTEGMRAVNHRIEMQQKECKAQLQLARKEQCDLKTQLVEQAEMVSKSTVDSQKLVADVQKLDGCLTRLDKKTRAMSEKQKEIVCEQQFAGKEHAESLKVVSKQMRTMDAVVKKIGNDTVQLECRMKDLQSIATENKEMKSKIDNLTANVATLSQTMEDQVRTTNGKFEVMATDNENRDRCLDVLKRAVELQLEEERQHIREAPLVRNADSLPAGNKRPHADSDDSSQSRGMAGGWLRWSQSLLPRKKMKEGDEKELEN